MENEELIKKILDEIAEELSEDIKNDLVQIIKKGKEDE